MPREPMPIGTWGKIRVDETEAGFRAHVYFRDLTGRRRQLERTATSCTKAENAVLRAVKARLEESPDHDLIGPETHVSALLEHWITEKSRTVAKGTVKTYQQTIDRHLAQSVGNLRIREATTPRLDRAVADLLPSISSAKLARTILQQAFAVALRLGAVTRNPATGIRPISSRKPKPTALSKQDIAGLRRLFQAHDATHDSELDVVAQMLMATGARIGEVLALRWQDIDLENGVVRITGIIEDGQRVEHTKTEAGERGLTLPKTVLDMLTARRVAAGCEIVLPSSRLTWRWPSNVRRQWRDALRGSSLEGTTPKAFRRSVATLLDREAGVEAAQAQLGHSSSDITTRFYIARQEQVVDFAGVIDTLFRS